MKSKTQVAEIEDEKKEKTLAGVCSWITERMTLFVHSFDYGWINLIAPRNTRNLLVLSFSVYPLSISYLYPFCFISQNIPCQLFTIVRSKMVRNLCMLYMRKYPNLNGIVWKIKRLSGVFDVWVGINVMLREKGLCTNLSDYRVLF